MYSRINTIALLCAEACNHVNEFTVTHTSWFGMSYSALVRREAHIDNPQQDISADDRFRQMVNNTLMLVRGDLENVAFEEESRRLVGASGFVLYTADKVVSSCIKHVHSILTDNINNELVVRAEVQSEVRQALRSSFNGGKAFL